MMGPHKAAMAFNAYVGILLLAGDADTLFEVSVQIDNDDRLTLRQKEALGAIIHARGQILKWSQTA